MIIYMITNLMDGKVYVGKSRKSFIDFENSSYYGSGIIIKKAIKKYGKECFERIILESGIETEKKLSEREKFWIAEMKSKVEFKEGYNISNGG